MNKIVLFLAAIIAVGEAYAQTPEDALRASWFVPNGTARNMAIGGVMGSLGGDITANYANPAGLGLYKTKEFVLSPGFILNNNKLSYRGADTNTNKDVFAYGPTGFVLGKAYHPSHKFKSSAFSIAVAQLASYNNRISFSGRNNTSSASEQYLEELTRDRADTNAALSNYIFGSSLAFRTYLIDKDEVNGQFVGYKSLVPLNANILQQYDAITRGGYHEVAVGFANNLEDKLYLGGSFNFPIINYRRELTYTERDVSGNTNNDFNYSTFKESFTSNGIGVNGRFGVIYKPKEFIRLGLALHTPSLISYRDQISSSMTTDTEGYAGVQTESSSNLNSGNKGSREYSMVSPWRAIASASYVFREVENTKKQRAFISADVELVNYRGARYYSVVDEEYSTDYYTEVNNSIKEIYKPNLNFKLGGELKFDPWMFRLGGAYYGSPYKSKDLKADRIIASGGIGYRNHGIFIDVTYSHSFSRDVQFPYVLNDKPNTFAQLNNNRGGVMMTLGFKL